MSIDQKTGSLIAVGASVTANCRPCLDSCVTRAFHSGADPADIADAVAIGRKVRAATESNFDTFAASLGIGAPTNAVASTTCDCTARGDA